MKPWYNKNFLIFTFILIIATSLRLLAILKYGDFWGDEMFSFTYSQKPWLDSMKFWLWETNPPLHLLLLKLWFYIVPATEFFARSLSLIIGVISIIFFYRLSCQLFNEKIAFLASFFLSAHSYHIFISSTTRTYALLILLIILSTDLFYKIFILDKKTKKNIIWFVVINSLMLFSHLTGIITLFAQLVALFILFRRQIIYWIKIVSIPIAIWLAWIIPSLTFKISTSFFGTAWYFGLGNDWTNLVGTLQSIFQGPSNQYIGIGIIFSFLLITTFNLYQQKKTNKLNTNFILLTIFILVPGTTFALTGLWNIKFFIIILPWTILLLVYLLDFYLHKILLTLIVLCLLLWPGLTRLNKVLPLNNWQTVNDYLSGKYNPAKKQVVIYEHFFDKILIDRYYQGKISIIPYTEGDQENQPEDYAIITTNYAMYLRPEKEINDWLDKKAVEQNDEIFLLHKDSLGININKVLESRGWKRQEESYPHLLEYQEIILYVKSQ
ncbi:MAG: hypothetical protein UR53_C0002G0080 [Candidatus Magasanikbacteria bacterium GW2011_GWC2_34_16]|uniref:Glycosyltransferase RgtA/B/C/D-like domain-containing protein n=2 Tax=Candidatus Magasanikiibacteriota TaxID=1752731 RepID=A0A0G0KJG8_9BACT|nr:MAG: hypothetical protein UR53_C0002G0080 [Candidatus Magasanikbacteria bacterium GW2011_GWC2_34_16]KKQ40726.1 MAG: hypothetical protein US58_C0013G0026 [Candidatus Magasanikbacteria bacterium GW2011_GWA2_37_8]